MTDDTKDPYNSDLKRFSEMDNVEVAKDDPDIRGWDVTAADGQDLGEVKDLLVDTTTMKVRAVEVELKGSHFNWNDNRRVVVPVDALRVNQDDDEVVVSGMRKDEIGALPAIDATWGRASDATAAAIDYGSSRPETFDETRGHAGFGSEERARSDERNQEGRAFDERTGRDHKGGR